MTPQEEELLNVKNEVEETKNPWRWGDELESQKKKSKLEDDSSSYTSVTELLKDEEEMEKKRLDEYFQKYSKRETLR